MTDGPADRDEARATPDPTEAAAGDGDEVPRDDARGDANFDEEPSLASILGAGEDDRGPRDITPGSPSLENVAFVVLGVLFTVFVLYRAWTVFVG